MTAPAVAADAVAAGRVRARRNRGVLPGFRLSLGYTVTYLSLLVLIPLAGLAWKSADLGWAGFWEAIAAPRALAAYALTSLYAENGWLGRFLEPLGIKVAFAPAGITVAMIFVGLPFVVRTVQPVLLEIDVQMEEAAATLGASRWTTVRRVILPAVIAPTLTGLALAFARAVGEYGSIVFISGNMPMKTEIVPLLIVTKLEQFDYAGATALALVMLAASFVMLIVINTLQAWIRRNGGSEQAEARR
jgi:sulfate transport system permease protein